MASEQTYLVVGLGNPGAEYEKHRHNVGFMAIDMLADTLRATSFSKKYHGEIAEAKLEIDRIDRVGRQAEPPLRGGIANASERKGEACTPSRAKRALKILLLKPQTYMNNSGRSVQAAASFYKIPPEHILVLHDELDLPVGKIRIKKGGGANGQNGIRDIDAAIGKEYWRCRIGINHPGDKARVHSHVLSNFGKEDAAVIGKLLEAIAANFPLYYEHSPEALMSKVTETLNPPRPKPPKPVDKAAGSA